MPDDILTPDEVAEIREGLPRMGTATRQEDAKYIILCDTVDALREIFDACVEALDTDKHTEPLDLPNRIRDLRESANEAARQCFTAEEILDARIKDLDDLRKQQREAQVELKRTRDEYLHNMELQTERTTRWEHRYDDLDVKIRSLTDALRDAKPALLRGADWLARRNNPWEDKTLSRADAVVLRALAEMGVEK